KFARLYPDECVLLVDTIDVLDSGVPNAIAVFQELRDRGHEPVGIRIDSGDLAYMTIQAAVALNDAGFESASIVLSSDLDELVIWQILSQLEAEAPRYDLDPAALLGRITFGVGTRLITSHGDSALGGVYKLVAIEDESGEWEPAIKLSESIEKMPVPGQKTVTRVYDERGLATADIIGIEGEDPLSSDPIDLYHPHRDLRRNIDKGSISDSEDLLETVYADGRRKDGEPDIEELRWRRRSDLERLDSGVRRLVNPHIYHVSLTRQMKDLQMSLVRRLSDVDPG
ncbi:MAG TPA: nicotinate phosphoribosyltransferase, partial [Acidimicrobiia bacterium]